MVTQITFTYPGMLWFLFAIPVLVFAHLYFMHHARRQAIRFGNFETIRRITGKRLLTRNALHLIARCLVVLALVLGAAGTTLWRESTQLQSDVVILIDSSASMIASDMNGTRLAAAKDAARAFVSQLPGTASIGVVQFSGLAEVLAAPTSERGDVLAAIDRVEIRTIGGTDLAGAITLGASLLTPSEKGRVLLLLTDGVASVSLYESDPLPRAIEYAKTHGVVVHTIGIGTQGAGLGAFIPGLEAQSATYDEQNLQAIADATGGKYAWARSAEQLQVAYEATSQEGNTGVEPVRLSFWLVFAGMIMLFFEWGLANTRYRVLP